MNEHSTAGADHDEVAGLVAAWAVDAVDDVERARVERHLRSCGSCQREADQLLAAAGAIGESLPTATPPRSLRDDVLAAIEQTEQEDRRRVPASDRSPAAAGDAGGDDGGRRLRLVAAGVAAALALVVGATAIVQLSGRVGEVEDELERVTALASEVTTRTWQASVDGVRLRVLAGEAGEAYVLTDGLPDDTAGRYVLWSISDGQPTNLGTLDAGRDATALPASAPSSIDVVAVSLEPDPSTTAPTTDPLVAVELTAGTS